MENNIDINQIVKVEQMPKIFSQLEQIGKYIDEKLEGIDELACTEQNKKDVKAKRTEINKTLEMLETRRKDIKKQLEEPYKLFEDKYKEECKEKLEEASKTLTSKINYIEDKQKKSKEKTLKAFFEQYKDYYHLDNVLKFEDLGLNITLSSSEKSLKDEIVAFCKQRAEEINLIIQEEYSEEIMYEYLNNGFDYINAKGKILERKKVIEDLKKHNENVLQKNEVEQENIENVENLVSPPKEIVEEEVYRVSFSVEATEKQLILLKQFMKTEGIKYND